MWGLSGCLQSTVWSWKITASERQHLSKRSTGPAGLRRAHARHQHQLLGSPWHSRPPAPFPDAPQKSLSPAPPRETSRCPEVSVPAPLTLPCHLIPCTDMSRPPQGRTSPPLLLPGEDPGVGAQPWARSELGGRLLERGLLRALAHVGSAPCCPPLPLLVPTCLPGSGQEDPSARTPTSHWWKWGPDLWVSPARSSPTQVTPEHSRTCSDRGVPRKHGLPASPTSLALSLGLGKASRNPLTRKNWAVEGSGPAAPRDACPCRGASHHEAEGSCGVQGPVLTPSAFCSEEVMQAASQTRGPALSKDAGHSRDWKGAFPGVHTRLPTRAWLPATTNATGLQTNPRISW